MKAVPVSIAFLILFGAIEIGSTCYLALNGVDIYTMRSLGDLWPVRVVQVVSGVLYIISAICFGVSVMSNRRAST